MFFSVTFYDQVIVLQAFGLTMATVVALTVYTFQSNRDYSTWAARYVDICLPSPPLFIILVKLSLN